ncbi:unnamed protein product, partial [Prorocentrum cordatum]
VAPVFALCFPLSPLSIIVLLLLGQRGLLPPQEPRIIQHWTEVTSDCIQRLDELDEELVADAQVGQVRALSDLQGALSRHQDALLATTREMQAADLRSACALQAPAARRVVRRSHEERCRGAPSWRSTRVWRSPRGGWRRRSRRPRPPGRGSGRGRSSGWTTPRSTRRGTPSSTRKPRPGSGPACRPTWPRGSGSWPRRGASGSGRPRPTPLARAGVAGAAGAAPGRGPPGG